MTLTHLYNSVRASLARETPMFRERGPVRLRATASRVDTARNRTRAESDADVAYICGTPEQIETLRRRLQSDLVNVLNSLRHKRVTEEVKSFIVYSDRDAVYVQIENLVRFAITSGVLKPGDSLPAVRALAQGLGVNPNTVTKAYRDLELFGIVSTRRGMGVRVTSNAEELCAEETTRAVLLRPDAPPQLVEFVRNAGLNRYRIWPKTHPSVVIKEVDLP